MRRLRVLIVDDEELARARIRTFLRDHPSVEVAGECRNVIEALAAIRDRHPEIVFMDVEMPGSNGFQLLADLPVEHRPAIILATAHDRFAIDAFAEQVVDYLLKPFDRKRLHLALKRAIDHLEMKRAGNLGARIESILGSALEQRHERLAVKSEGSLIFLKPDEIIWVEAANNYSTLHLVGAKRLLVRETLSAIEKRFGSPPFVRVNRSAVVHLDQVKELQPAKYGDHQVILKNGARLPLSRNLRGRFAKFATDTP